MSKSNKELAVDVAIAYIQANGNRKQPNGGSTKLLTVDNVSSIIKSVYQTIENLPDSQKE